MNQDHINWQIELDLDRNKKIISRASTADDGRIFAFGGRKIPEPLVLDRTRPIEVGMSSSLMPVISREGELKHVYISRDDLYLVVARFEWAIELSCAVSDFSGFIASRKEASESAVLEPRKPSHEFI